MTPQSAVTQTSVIMEVRNLRKLFPLRQKVLARLLRKEEAFVHAVDGVTLQIPRGVSEGIVGESGCGKSTLGRLMVRLADPTEGEITFDGIDVLKLSETELRECRRRFQMVFQDPYSTLNPRMRVGQILAEALLVHRVCERREVNHEVEKLLRLVEMPAASAGRFPAQLSGGQRQRVGIARALAVRPELIVADEPVSSLDVSVQAQILNLINNLKRELGLTWVFIGHNLGVVRQVSDRIAVMYLGRIVEEGPTDELFNNPRHPYTEALLSSVPHPDPRLPMTPPLLRGDPPPATQIPDGCRFHSRCRLARPFCAPNDPSLVPISREHYVACWAVTHPALWGSSDITPKGEAVST